jgi:hypothetical protein
MPTDMNLWAEFYGEPLQAQPSSLDLLNLLAQIGVAADYEVVTHRFSWTFGDINEAVSQLGNTLCLPHEDDEAMAKLRELLQERLITWPNGRLGPQVGPVRSAILSWAPPKN